MTLMIPMNPMAMAYPVDWVNPMGWACRVDWMNPQEKMNRWASAAREILLPRTWLETDKLPAGRPG